MSDLKLSGLPTEEVEKIRETQCDANGQSLETKTSDGSPTPCRHCLQMVEDGEEFYVLAYRPFSTIQPYAELGPIFLHKKHCAPYLDTEEIPEALANKDELIVRGYDQNERIVYGTGEVVPKQKLRSFAKTMFLNQQVKFIHIRSANNNCYQARIDSI